MARRVQAAIKLAAEGNIAAVGGMEFYPLAARSEFSPVILHHAGCLPGRSSWSHDAPSPFWRLRFDWSAEGAGELKSGGRPAGGGRLLVIPAHHPVQSAGAELAPVFWLGFSCGPKLSPRQAVPIEVGAAQIEADMVEHLTGLLRTENPESHRLRILYGSVALLSLVLGRPEFDWSAGEPPTLSLVIRHINENPGTPLYNNDLARMANMSESTFSRLFRARHDLSPAQFVARARVRAAMSRLLDTPESVDQIAEKTGFPNRAYFSRVFRRVTGESPAFFRRRHAPKGLASQVGEGQRLNAKG